MKYKLIISNKAKTDFINIFDYMIAEFHAPQTAKNLISEINRKTDNLKTQPFMCPVSTDSPLHELGFRKLCVKNYVVIYSVNENDNTVNILRVFYGGQDYKRFFK